jgi:hypothetical protein
MQGRSLAARRRQQENLCRVADALPANRFEPYILFAKLAPFTPEEIALARILNGE